ncbi:hypothetical protein CPB83DRAFT_844622 [Crepidotus variabilis]|uniref:Secreted protein n=1 Tax=Crepidotus variabilis TaxID=179855 RepID=A0A9P6ES48_9AGAR|nr:hypothetical protein CPB83DRAFT_844622 [Crepidotus variabilis]
MRLCTLILCTISSPGYFLGNTLFACSVFQDGFLGHDLGFMNYHVSIRFRHPILFIRNIFHFSSHGIVPTCTTFRARRRAQYIY